MRFLLLLFLFCLSATTYGQEKRPVNQVDEQGNKHGVWYVKTPARMGEPATVETGNYDHGKRTGIWYMMDGKGEMMSVESYKNGLLHGDVKYFENGKVFCTGRFRSISSKKLRDTIVVVDPITQEETYKVINHEQGTKRHGTWRYFEPSTGQLLREEEYQVDELVFQKNYAPAPSIEQMNKRIQARRLPHKSGQRYTPPADKQYHYIDVLKSD